MGKKGEKMEKKGRKVEEKSRQIRGTRDRNGEKREK